MALFKVKGKRSAHQAQYDIEELKKLKELKLDEPLELNAKDSANRILASGEVFIGNVLTKKKFKQLESNKDEIDKRLYGSCMTLRERVDLPCNYRGAYFLGQQRELLEYFARQNERQRNQLQKKINAVKCWPASPLFSAKPLLCRPQSGRADQWDSYLQEGQNASYVAPVEYFKKAPLADVWSDLAKVGVTVEVRNPFVSTDEDVYSSGQIMQFAGYRALVQFGSKNQCPPYVAWISYCSDVPKPVGWAVKNGKRLINVDSDEDAQSDDAPSIPSNHLENIKIKLNSIYELNGALPIEVHDPENPDQYVLARIIAKTGNKVQVCCENGLVRWLNINTDVHPFGWANAIGICRSGRCADIVGLELKGQLPKFIEQIDIQVGMTFEARHPRMKHKIVAAVVTEVLNHQYFVGETRENNSITRVSSIYHISSPFIFPAGWCTNNGIKLRSSRMKSAARLDLAMRPERDPHNFKTGMKLEAILSSPDGDQYVVAATIQSIFGHLLLIHYDGTTFTEVNTKYVDVEYSDIYPAGYAELLGIKFRGVPGGIGDVTQSVTATQILDEERSNEEDEP